MAHLNYHVLGQGLPLHRTVVQRLLRDLLTRLAIHIIGSALLKARRGRVVGGGAGSRSVGSEPDSAARRWRFLGWAA